jgi:hypothetical protein
LSRWLGRFRGERLKERTGLGKPPNQTDAMIRSGGQVCTWN